MRQKVLLMVLALLVIGAGAAFGQLTATHDIVIDITAVAAIAVDTPAVDVTLNTIAPLLPGDPVGGSSGNKAIFYTVLTPLGNPYRITAAVDAIQPAGTAVSVTATPGAGNGTGATITLDTVAQNLITAIGSTATGRDPLTAPDLEYTLVITDSTQLVPGSGTRITVTLTLVAP